MCFYKMKDWQKKKTCIFFFIKSFQGLIIYCIHLYVCVCFLLFEVGEMSRRVLQLSEGSVNTTKRPKVTLQTLNACTHRQTHACVCTNAVVLASRCLKIKERAAVVCPVGFFPVFTKHTHMISQLQVNLNTHNHTYIQCQECCRSTVTNMRRKMMQKDVTIMIKSAKSLAVPAFF